MANIGNIHWRIRLSPSRFIKNRMWMYLRSVYKSLPADVNHDLRFLPYDVQATMIHRGEIPMSFRGIAREEFGGVFVLEKGPRQANVCVPYSLCRNLHLEGVCNHIC